MKKDNRVLWVDVAKFLGIFAIYLGHFGEQAGLAYHFVFSYHVPLFFLLSGCMDTYDNERNLWKYVKKNFKAIMIPFFGFGILSIFIYILLTNCGMGDIKVQLLILIKGAIRNQFFAVSLWFLSCLFIIKILFKIIKYLKNNWGILIICIALYVVAEIAIDPRPILQPHWWYNFDSAIYYIIYYAFGYVLYPYILKLFELNLTWKKIVFIISGVITLLYSALVFEGKNVIALLFQDFGFGFIFINIISALLIIWLNLVVAKLLERVQFFLEIGRETLYLCGNEYIIKMIFPSLLSLFGLQLTIENPLCAFLYVVILLFVTNKVLIRAEKMVIKLVKANWLHLPI